MAWARFSTQYEHRWPSRAITVYRPDRGVDGSGLYSVKREVLDAAKAAGKATEAKKPATPHADGAEREAVDDVADRDPAADRDDASGDELEPDDGDRGGDELPEPDRAG